MWEKYAPHLEELRRRTITSIAILGITSCIGWAISGKVLETISRWYMSGAQLTAITPLDAAFARMNVSLATGFVLAFPVVLYEALAFVIPALKPEEKRMVYRAIAPGIGLFAVGVIFGGSVVLPVTMRFLSKIVSPNVITYIWSVNKTVSFILGMLIAFGVIFEYPLVAVVLIKTGIVKVETLKKHRRLAALIILIIAGIITPDPTFFCQMMVAVPMYALYELGILLGKLF